LGGRRTSIPYSFEKMQQFCIETMASKRVLALEVSSTLKETKQAIRKIVLHTNTDHDSIFGAQYRNDIVRA
jgi:hypothetical protein